MRLLLSAGACALVGLFSCTATAGEPDDHAPAGVMGDHLHKEGDWMVGYHFESTHSKGMRNGAHSISNADAMARYGEIPAEMDMDMHMFEIMGGITPDLSVMIMPQYMTMSMLHQSSHGGGHSHRHEVSGFGDTEVTGLYSVYRGERDRAHLNFGLSLPTGSIDESFVDHHGNTYRMPYNMQFGSGTYDPILGATYVSEEEGWSWGAQTINYIRLGKNDNGYRQGNKYTATSWVAHNLSDYASLSFRVEGEAWGNVSGQDADLPSNIMAGADPEQQAGKRVMASAGMNLWGGEGALKGQRVLAEFGVPIYEQYSGPQPDTDWRLSLSWQWAF